MMIFKLSRKVGKLFVTKVISHNFHPFTSNNPFVSVIQPYRLHPLHNSHSGVSCEMALQGPKRDPEEFRKFAGPKFRLVSEIFPLVRARKTKALRF